MDRAVPDRRLPVPGAANKNHGLRRDLCRISENRKDYAVFVIVRMHLAHNTFLTLRPFTITVTFCRFGRKARLVARIEKDRLWPKVVTLPQCAHLAIVHNPF
jgi:hypothetical protein